MGIWWLVGTLFHLNFMLLCYFIKYSRSIMQRYTDLLNIWQTQLWSARSKFNRGWVIIIWTGLNIKIDIVQKIYEWSSCSFAKMIPRLGNNFAKICTAWSLIIYFLNYRTRLKWLVLDQNYLDGLESFGSKEG